MARIITKGLIGQQDLNLGTSTFTRATSTGGTQVLNQINLATFQIAATVNAASQAAAIASTLLYAVPAGNAGIYRLTTHLMVRTANAVVSAVQALIATNNGIVAQSFTTGTIDCSQAAGSEFQSIREFYSAASQNINYSTTVAVALGAGLYDLRLRLEYLG